MRDPRRAAACAGVLGFVIGAFTGCSAADVVRGCTSAEPRLVEELKAATRTGAGPGDLVVDRVEVGKVVTVDLPDDLRRFGADRLLAARASVYDADPPSPDFPGIEVNAFVAIDADGRLIAPIGRVTDIGFTIEGPDDLLWRSWTAEVYESDQVATAQSCVDPHA